MKRTKMKPRIFRGWAIFKRSHRFYACVSVLIWLAAVSAAAQDTIGAPRKLEPVTLGLSAKQVVNLPIYVAQTYGIFKSEGFDFKPITAKTSTIIAALVSGDLDYITAFNSGLGPAIGGAPLVATFVSTDKSFLYLISRPDIKDAKGLRGGIIGHGGTRGGHYHDTVAMVKHLGLDPEKDVKLISTIDVTQGMAALFSGAVAAVTLSAPYDSMAVRKGFNRLVSGPDVLPRFITTGLVMRRAKLRDNPDQVRRMLRALVRGLHYTIDRPHDAVALIQKDWNLDRETAQIAYDVSIPTFNLKGESPDEIISAAIKRVQQDAKIVSSNFMPKDYVDWTLIRKVHRELQR
ncbi:MAG: ABC transporter substrate-binding protein [Deltaproteobacteria bacterium]|nr:ABC transporter substrate-binding protein [Deltaproteobacteria bacterium]